MTQDRNQDDDTGECGPCARGGGVLLTVIGGALVYIGLDLITGGALTRLVTGGAAAGLNVAADVIASDNNETDGADDDGPASGEVEATADAEDTP